MDIKKEQIIDLVNEAVEGLGAYEIYNRALTHVDVADLYKRQPLSAEEISMHFSVAGFMEGIAFALENLEIHDDEKTDLEQ